MKLRLRLKTISRCLAQSWMTVLIVWSYTPQKFYRNTNRRQNSKFSPKATKKQFFRLQFVSIKVSMPNFKVQPRIIASTQKETRDSQTKKQLIAILTTTKITKAAAVSTTLDSSLEKGYYLTLAQSILITATSRSCCYFFFLGLSFFSGRSSGGMKRTAPLGKKRKFGKFLLMN